MYFACGVIGSIRPNSNFDEVSSNFEVLQSPIPVQNAQNIKFRKKQKQKTKTNFVQIKKKNYPKPRNVHLIQTKH